MRCDAMFWEMYILCLQKSHIFQHVYIFATFTEWIRYTLNGTYMETQLSSWINN